jgi:hypothetical protein
MTMQTLRLWPLMPRLLATALLAAVAGCGQGHEAAGSSPPPVHTEPTAPAIEAVPAGPYADDPLAGTWWVLTPTHPFLALRLTLVGTETPGELEGNWISFDWRATTQAESLVRKSKAVKVSAQRTGERAAPERLVIEGATPMLDENGVPNGQQGIWRIDLQPSHLPGESLRFQGRGVQSVLAEGEGVVVDLVRDFRVWKP